MSKATQEDQQKFIDWAAQELKDLADKITSGQVVLTTFEKHFDHEDYAQNGVVVAVPNGWQQIRVVFFDEPTIERVSADMEKIVKPEVAAWIGKP